jgi:hypothetical protein
MDFSPEKAKPALALSASELAGQPEWRAIFREVNERQAAQLAAIRLAVQLRQSRELIEFQRAVPEPKEQRSMLLKLANWLDRLPQVIGDIADAVCRELGLPKVVGALAKLLMKHVVKAAFPAQVLAAHVGALSIRLVGAVLFDEPGKPNPFADALTKSLGDEVAAGVRKGFLEEWLVKESPTVDSFGDLGDELAL